MIGESTYVLRKYEDSELIAAVGGVHHLQHSSLTNRNDIDLSHWVHSDKSRSRLDDFLRLEINPSKSDTDLVSEKNDAMGLEDIHLEDAREWSGNLYTQLYGISETWLSLVSRTTRLANVLGSLDTSRSKKTLEVLESLERRKQELENMICSFAATDDGEDFVANELTEMDTGEQKAGQLAIRIPRACMVRALNSALVIYFYRRIKNVNPLILQDHVNHVMRALKDFDKACETHQVPGPGSPWPAFIAGSEAKSSAQREFFAGWFDSAFQCTGFTRLQSAKSCMLEVWKRHQPSAQRRDKSAMEEVQSWVHVCKERNLYINLS